MRIAILYFSHVHIQAVVIKNQSCVFKDKKVNFKVSMAKWVGGKHLCAKIVYCNLYIFF